MRLWHSKLIPLLDGRRLCDLHMSCCNLRGNGWGKKNKNINYIYDDPLGEEALATYHRLVLVEMASRGYNFDKQWYDAAYCGKNRPMRLISSWDLNAAYRREGVPLQGHTLELYLKDISDLKERGLDIELICGELFVGSHKYESYEATRGNITTIYNLRRF